MKLIVNPHKIEIEKELVNELEVNVTKINFEFNEVIPNNYVKKVFFKQGDVSKVILLEGNQCDIPNEVLYKKGQVRIGVIAYEIQDETLIERYNPSPAYFEVLEGSLVEADNTEPITPTDKEQIEQALVDLEANKQDNLIAGDNITIEDNVISATGGGTGTSDYSRLSNKPKINNVELNDNKTLNDLGIQAKGNYIEDSNYVHTDNNYTTTEKNKLANLENYDDSEIKSDINDLETNKADRSEIPDVSNFITRSVDNLLNYYLKSETYTKTEVNNLISAITNVRFEVVNELPVTGESNVIYLVPSSNPETRNIKDEYIWINNSWEQIGSTAIDLSDYVTTSDLNTALSYYTTTTDLTTLLNGKQNTIDSSHKLSSDLVDDTNNTNKFVTSAEKTTWNSKGTYSKPSGGIPKSDLDSSVQTSLGKADTALQSETYTGTITSVKMNGSTVASSGEADLGTVITQHQDISGKEDKSNKVTSISSSSTDTQYPSAKCVYDLVGDIESLLSEV